MWKSNRRSEKMVHQCSLPINDHHSQLPKLRPYSPKYKYYLRKFRKLFLASEFTFQSHYIRSRARLALMRRTHIRSKYWYVIHPLSIFVTIESSIMVFLYLIYFLGEPLVFGIYKVDLTSWACSNLIFGVDILLKFNTGYIAHNTKEIVLHSKLIAIHYLKTYFFVDLFGNLLVLPTICITSEQIVQFSVGTIQYLIRLIRIITVMNWFRSVTDYFRISKTIYDISTLIFLMLLFIHNAGCFLYTTAYIVESIDPVISTWLDNEPQMLHIYLESIMLGTQLFLHSGMGKHAYSSIAGRLLYSLVLIVGFFFMIYSHVVVALMVSRTESASNRHEFVIANIHEYCRQKCMPVTLRNRVISHYNYHYHYKYFNEQIIWNTLSDHLKCEIILANCLPLVKSQYFFKSLSKSCVGFIIGKLKHEIYLWNDVLYKVGDVATGFFLISKGTIAVYGPDGVEVFHANDNSCVGITPRFEESTRIFSAVAVELSEVYILYFSDLYKALEKDPENMEKILEKTVIRYNFFVDCMKNRSHYTYEDVEAVLSL